ncbi:MAG: V-type ATP synthase subunit I [Tissierellia bacterium]|nr:V-type ATP synthase subunit I [Tissierellia bacterium]
MQMAIVKMSNFSLFAFDSNRDDLLHELQKFEYVHFKNLDEDEDLKEEGLESVTVPESIVEVDEEISKVKYVIDLLSKYHEEDSGLKAMLEGKTNLTFEELQKRASSIDYLPVYEELRELALKADELNREEKQLNALKEELKHWEGLEYPIKDLRTFEQSNVFIGTLPKKLEDKLQEDLLDLEYTYAEVISEDKDNVYLFALVSKDESEKLNEILRNNSFSTVKLEGEDTPKEEIASIDENLRRISEENKEIEGSIVGLVDNLPKFEIVYDYLTNKKLRLSASENFLKTEKVDVIEGYVPTSMEDDFEKVVKKALPHSYYLEIEEADKDDPDVPVLLENSKFAESFESLTSMYALPKYNEIDPTPLFAPFYLAFFGMMVADMGYGLLMLIGTSIILRKANLEDSTKKFIRFFFYLSFSVIAWGALYGSFFGDIFPIKGLVDPAEDYQSLLILSIVFGLIHLFFALGISAYMKIRDKDYKGALFDVGFWYMALAGGIVFLLTMVVTLSPLVKTISKTVMIIGMAGIVLTGGRDAKSIGGKLGGGIYELYGISGYVGDFVSYSRLMALGLSGGFISVAVNMMAGMLFESGILGILFGIVVLIGGQLFNVFLSLLGSYVHTSRLIYVEFFGKFYEGGGKSFNLFRSKPKFINLK